MGLFGPPNVEKLKANNDVKGLIKALGYMKDSGVRKAAAAALGEVGVGDYRAVEPLIAALKDEDVYVRRHVAEALGEIGDPHAMLSLIACLKKDSLICDQAAQALVQILSTNRDRVENTVEILGELLYKHGDEYGGAAQVLALIGSPAVPALIHGLSGLGEQEARAALIKIGAPAVGPLLNSCPFSDLYKVRILGEIGNPRAVEALIALLNNKDDKVRQGPAEALVKIGAPAVDQLIIALEDRDLNPHAHKAAAAVLGRIGDARAVEPLIATLSIALKDGDLGLLEEAACALGNIGDARATRPLVVALKNSWGVSLASAQAPDKLGWQPDQGTSVGASYWIAKLDWDRCVQIGAPAVEPLMVALQVQDRRIRIAATKTLGQIGDTRAVEPLIATLNTALKDKELGLLQEAAGALVEIGDARAIESLVALLEVKDVYIRHTGAESLVRMYRSDKIMPSQKQRILAHRSSIAQHSDVKHHRDGYVCGESNHTDIREHSDTVDFQL